MQQKEAVIARIRESGLVATVRAETPDEAIRITEACIEGGVAAIEITFTVPGADKVIQTLSERYRSGEILVGAGTVMDAETARTAILAGAQYIVSPYFNVETVRLCTRYRIACMPGAMTIKEVVEAMESGVEIVKLFPGELLGPAFIKAVRGPIPQVQLMPTGGVTLENVGDWIRAGAVAVGVGGNLTAGAKKGDYGSITTIAREFIGKIREARG